MNNKVYYHTAPYKIEAVNDILTLPTEKYVTLEYLYCGICGGDYSTYIEGVTIFRIPWVTNLLAGLLT